MSDNSISSEVTLSDSIYSNSPIENDKRRGEVIDMSRNRDKTMTKMVIRKGKGWSTPMNGDEVSIHYVAKLEDGTVFDSTRDRNQVFTFTVGHKQVVRGLDIAIKTMKWSEISLFTFSEDSSFNETNCPPSVTPRAKITYEVELFYFKLIDLTKKKDEGIKKRIITPGVGYDLAIFGSKCDIDIIGKYNNRVFEERSVSFTVGEASEQDLIDAIDIAVTKMRKKEKSLLFIKPLYAFGPKGKPEFDIPENYEEVVYEITLKEFSIEKEPFEMWSKEKLSTSEAIKLKGNNYYNESKYQLALNQYKRMVKILKHDSSKDFGSTLEPESDVREFESGKDKLLYIAYQNLANCYQKMDNFRDSLQYIEMALKIDPTNAKGLYRRGRAYFGLEEYELARDDFNASLRLDATNRSAHNYVILCNNAIKTNAHNERQLFGKMFATKAENTIELKESGDVSTEEEKDSDKDISK